MTDPVRRPDEGAVAGDDGPERLEATVRGRVQGVGFRYFVALEADELGLRGWVRNEPDGSVHVLAEGPRVSLERLAAALAVGPRGARVDDVATRWGPGTGALGRFAIRSGGHGGD